MEKDRSIKPALAILAFMCLKTKDFEGKPAQTNILLHKIQRLANKNIQWQNSDNICDNIL